MPKALDLNGKIFTHLKVLNKATSFNDSLVSLVNSEKINNLITSI